MKDFDSLSPDEKDRYIKYMNSPERRGWPAGTDHPLANLEPELTEESCSPELWKEIGINADIKDDELPF